MMERHLAASARVLWDLSCLQPSAKGASTSCGAHAKEVRVGLCKTF